MNRFSVHSQRHYHIDSRHWLFLLVAVLLGCVLSAGVHANKDLDSPNRLGEMREGFRVALQSLESGNTEHYFRERNKLDDYPLTGYLDYRYLQTQTGQLMLDDIEAFRSRQYPSTFNNAYWADRLLASHLRGLASRKRWDEFNTLYQPRLADNSMRCQHLQALYKTKQYEAARSATQTLWLTPRSLPKTCDKPFARFIANIEKHPTPSAETDLPDLAWQRFVAAFKARELTLARYLLRFLDEDRKQLAQQLLDSYRQPKTLVNDWRGLNGALQRQLSASDKAKIDELLMKRLARHDANAVISLIDQYYKKRTSDDIPQAVTFDDGSAANTSASLISESLYLETARYLINRQALQDYAEVELLFRRLGSPHDDLIGEWLLRAAIYQGRWSAVPELITRLSSEKQQQDRWRYWQLRSKALLGELSDTESTALSEIAHNTNFYGFMSAQLLGQPYHIQPQTISNSELGSIALLSKPELRRSIEYFIQGLYDIANQEWNRAVRRLTPDERINAAYLAAQYQWHFQAINTLAGAGAWQHYNTRFPNILSDEFVAQALRLGHSPHWFYAVARQESALSPLAKSGAGALGLMQLLPSTAKQQAKSLGLEFEKTQLFDEQYNIQLGTAYLDHLHDKYRSIGLSSAAYNAGPRRVDQWLNGLSVPIPMDAWIESIRFSETRQYVQNVLSFALIHSTLYPELNAKHNPWPQFEFAQAVAGNVYPNHVGRLAKQ